MRSSRGLLRLAHNLLPIASAGFEASTSGRGVLHSCGAALQFPYAAQTLHSGCRQFASATPKRKELKTASELALYWGAAAVFMVGLSYASVPLYRIFCAATGYGGTVGKLGKTVEDKIKARQEQPDTKLEEAAASRELRIWFNADVADDMPWKFVPTQEYVRVKPGQSTLVFFTATNMSDKPVTGYSLYSVQPDKAAFYFNKIQCFCFEEQRLRPRESLDMPVLFYIDPEFATDWNCRKIHDITLSYSFHKVDNEEEEEVDDSQPSQVKLHNNVLPASSVAAAS